MILLAASLLVADLKVDHITIAGRDLKQLQNVYAKAGIHSEYGGKHTNGLTEMAIASFLDGSYLEFIAAQKPSGAPSHYWGRFIDGNAGPCAWAISVPEIAGAGFGVQPQKSGRLRGDGVQLEWESASLGPEPQGTFFPFLIHDLTPRERRAFPRGQPSEPRFAGVGLVVIGVKDLDVSIQRYRDMFHLPEPARQEDLRMNLHLAAFAGTPVVLASPTRPNSALAIRLEAFGEAPYLFVFDQAPNTVAGGFSSEWFGREIIWNEPLGFGIRKIRR
jgi:hypothetical protein